MEPGDRAQEVLDAWRSNIEDLLRRIDERKVAGYPEPDFIDLDAWGELMRGAL